MLNVLVFNKRKYTWRNHVSRLLPVLFFKCLFILNVRLALNYFFKHESLLIIDYLFLLLYSRCKRIRKLNKNLIIKFNPDCFVLDYKIQKVLFSYPVCREYRLNLVKSKSLAACGHSWSEQHFLGIKDKFATHRNSQNRMNHKADYTKCVGPMRK